jgi:hypothetical protein
MKNKTPNAPEGRQFLLTAIDGCSRLQIHVRESSDGHLNAGEMNGRRERLANLIYNAAREIGYSSLEITFPDKDITCF